MKVSSLVGAATARTAMLQTSTPSAATTLGAGPPVTRPVAMPPPPRASSFGGADPRAMFEALVQSFDSDGNGTLSLNEVNALNQGGLLARSFGRIDANADGAITDARTALTSATKSLDDMQVAFADFRKVMADARAAIGNVNDFAAKGLPQYTVIGENGARLIQDISKLVARIERDPTRFFLSNRTPEYNK